MKKITLKSLFTFAALAFALNANAQKSGKLNNNLPGHRNCGLEQHEQELLKNPEYAKTFYEGQAKFQQKLAEIHSQKMNGTYQKKATLYIPVAVHFPENSETDRTCLEAFAKTQIDVINEDYTATNADISNWGAASTHYPGLVPGSVDVVFCIATINHPATGDPEVTEGNPLITIGANGSNFGNWPESDTRYSGYMNFIIKDAGAGILGYSPLGGSIANGNAVVMSYSSYGTGAGCSGSAGTPDVIPGAPYNLGRTVTHELGHFYNLNHTFESCAGDGIADTPAVNGASYGCPADGSVNGCTATPALTMNYMDYVNDACMYMFTPGQATVMEAYFASVAGDWKTNVLDCTGPNFSATATDFGNCGADTAQTTVTFTTQNGFNETTTFSVSGVPAGATSAFSPTTLNADGTTTLTISNLTGVVDGDYTLTVTGTSASVTKNFNVNLSVGTNVCNGQATSAYATSVTRVNIGTIDNTTSLSDTDDASGYSDFSATQITDVNIDESYPLIVQVNTAGAYIVDSKVWIDWNHNCIFDVPSEEYDLGNAEDVANGAVSNSGLSITVPSNAELGNTTMRVVARYANAGDGGGIPVSCGSNTDGEVEDYTLNVKVALTVEDNQFDVFGVYPNPSNGEVAISLSTNKDVNVSLFDIRGRKVYGNLHNNASDSFNEKVDFSSMASGVYMLEVQSGSKRAIKKLVIQ